MQDAKTRVAAVPEGTACEVSEEAKSKAGKGPEDDQREHSYVRTCLNLTLQWAARFLLLFISEVL